MTDEISTARSTPAPGAWWAAYDDGARHFVVPVVCFDQHGAPYVWSAETHRPVAAVRTAFVGLVSDAYRGEYGELVAAAIKRAASGHRGEAYPVAEDTDAHASGGAGDARDTIRDGIEKARDAIHEATDARR